jgi:hypothetical protein
MFISGHLKILKDLFSTELFNKYFSFLKTKNYINFNKKNTYKGIIIVDLPCDIYKIQNNHVYTDLKLCKTYKLLNLYNSNNTETTLWQRHKGYFSHLHSMSTDPSNNVEKIRNKIITSILGYSLLALYDTNVFDINRKFKPNSIWVGMILHVITDSYSKAHTIRNKNFEFLRVKKEKNKFEIQISVHEEIKNLAKIDRLYKSSIDFLIDLKIKCKQDNKTRDYIESQDIRLYNMYKGFKFEYDINKIVKSNSTNYPKDDNYDNYGDIINFQFYGTQPPLLHYKFDFYHFIKKDKIMYSRMINECTEYLILYTRALETGDIKTFLYDLTNFLLTKTFHINKKYLKDKTDKIYYDKNFVDIKLLQESIKFITTKFNKII